MFVIINIWINSSVDNYKYISTIYHSITYSSLKEGFSSLELILCLIYLQCVLCNVMLYFDIIIVLTVWFRHLSLKLCYGFDFRNTVRNFVLYQSFLGLRIKMIFFKCLMEKIPPGYTTDIWHDLYEDEASNIYMVSKARHVHGIDEF